MRAILSGQAGLALLGDDDAVWAVSVEAPEERNPCDWGDAPFLLADAHDVVELPDVSLEKALDELEQAWRRDRALQLMLILLDREEDADTRTMAAECIDEHFASEKIRQYVANRLYSAPLPSSAELGRAEQLAGDAKALKVVAFLAKLKTDQAVIARTRSAWDKIKPDTFGGDEGKARFEAVAVDAGAFRRLAEALDAGNVQQAWWKCLSDSQIKRLPRHRNVITAWTSPLHQSPRESQGDAESRAARLGKHDAKGSQESGRRSKPARGPTIHQRWTRVEKEITTILRDIDKGRVARALQFTQELVERQKSEENEEFAVKTLCKLAKEMKDRQLHDLQLQFAQWATDEFAWDAQAHIQLADAYLCLGRVDDALAQYDEAILRFPNNAVACRGRGGVLRKLGRFDDALAQYEEAILRSPEDAFGRNGRGEVLRNLGRFDDALAQYEETILRFPNDAVALCGRGEVLRDLGRVHDALAQYDEAIRRFPDDVFARNGSSEVLRELGRLDDALAQYEKTILRFSNDAVARCGYSEVLRELGRLDDALAQYDEAILRFPNDAFAFCGLGEVLRELGRLDDALAQYEEAIRRFPSNVVAYCGRGEVLRDLGRFDDALAQYDATLAGFPTNRVALNAKAHVLIELKRYDQALSLLSTDPPRTKDDWIGFHVRGMAHLRRGDSEIAIELFQQGVRKCPFSVQVAYFRNALAVAQLGQKRYADALHTLGDQTGEVADVLRLHAEGEMGQKEEARAAHQRLQSSQRPRVIGVRDKLAAVFLVDDSVAVIRTAEWYEDIYEQECTLVAHRIAA